MRRKSPEKLGAEEKGLGGVRVVMAAEEMKGGCGGEGYCGDGDEREREGGREKKKYVNDLESPSINSVTEIVKSESHG